MFDLDSDQWIMQYNERQYGTSPTEGDFSYCWKDKPLFVDIWGLPSFGEAPERIKEKAQKRGWLIFNLDGYGFEIFHREARVSYSYLYIIRYGTQDVYKIGISKKPESRLKSLQTGSPFELEIIFTHKVAPDNATYVESRVHKWLSFNKLRGELFAVSDCLIDRLKSRIHLLHSELIDVDPDMEELSDEYISMFDSDIEPFQS